MEPAEPLLVGARLVLTDPEAARWQTITLIRRASARPDLLLPFTPLGMSISAPVPAMTGTRLLDFSWFTSSRP
ncbi:hypothetical protein ADK75_25735 [Streptomyces virginiae]|uniref:Uncharacterized protein n=1 Tax=Streptomyces virginiae TaxID=1961 RepID=A0A0L8M8P5_STRVG|nr:hypothetical protein ADK75_25735 [Streptomyces virginiae]